MAFPTSNLLIESLPSATKEVLMRQLEPVAMPVPAVLYDMEAAPRYVHFMTSGIASTVTMLSAGDAVEVGLVGREGIGEKIHLLGPQLGSTRCFMQLGGTALRMPFKHFEQIFFEDAAVHRSVLRLVQHESLVLAQLGACNRLHEVEERLARWLLMVQDRTGEPDMRLTQEFLAEMLGARRSTVSVVAGTLQRSGMIEYRRSYIRIVDRERLEAVACECYPVIRKLLADLYKGLPAVERPRGSNGDRGSPMAGRNVGMPPLRHGREAD
ncbi:MAG TPA: Crp/Fnr family transcriptional regulator [Acidobacteriaceae bacterium]|jgi:CRP-like cAMP-binding protein|nr:Crp/Fnr family transcriptional regulator [Acidobacteriaceae bacterium]